MTSWPRSARARATARPTTPAPITRTCITLASARNGGLQAAVYDSFRPKMRLRYIHTYGAAARALPNAGSRRDRHLRRGGAYVGVHVGLELLEILLEHAH